MSHRQLIGCVLFTLAACGQTPEPQRTEAQVVLQRINTEGASAVARALVADQATWSALTGKIAGGANDWVDVALALRKGSDAGASSELQSALFLALGKNPSYVLQKVDDSSGLLSTICVGRVDPPEPYDAAVAEIRAVRAAVEGVTVPESSTRKALCITKLLEGELALKKMFGITEES